MEKQDERNANGDGRIGDIEYGAEEQKLLIAPKRYPGREMPFDDREIEHIYHFAMQKGSVASTLREELGDLIAAIGEKDAVKGAVENVAERAGKDESEAGN